MRAEVLRKLEQLAAIDLIEFHSIRALRERLIEEIERFFQWMRGLQVTPVVKAKRRPAPMRPVVVPTAFCAIANSL